VKSIWKLATTALLSGWIGLLAAATAHAQEKSRLDEVLARGKLIVGVTS
jgi:polar amino acid transport system substrate-binding protein